MARKARTLLDTLILLDAYARQHAPAYEESETQAVVSSLINKAQARVRNRVKKLASLDGQLYIQDVQHARRSGS